MAFRHIAVLSIFTRDSIRGVSLHVFLIPSAIYSTAAFSTLRSRCLHRPLLVVVMNHCGYSSRFISPPRAIPFDDKNFIHFPPVEISIPTDRHFSHTIDADRLKKANNKRIRTTHGQEAAKTRTAGNNRPTERR